MELVLRIRTALTCTLLTALTALVLCCTVLVLRVDETMRKLPDAVRAEARITREAVLAQAGQLQRDVVGQVAGARTDARGEIRHATDTAAEAIAEATDLADRRLGDALTRVGTALGTIQDLRGDLQAVLDPAASVARQVEDAVPLWLDCEGNPSCAFNIYQGTARAVERAAVDVAGAGHDFRGALPPMLAGVDQIVANSERSTAHTAVVMENLAKATKPLPTWMRIGLAVSPPLVQMGTSVITTMALTGKK